jgi:hypothetical protein
MSLSSNLRQNPRAVDSFTHSKQVIGDACAHPSPTPFAPSSPHAHRFQGSSPLRETRLPHRRSREAELAAPQVPADRRELLTSFKARSASAAPQVPASSANSDAVNPVSLYAPPTQVLPLHQLPQANSQVSNDAFSCIPVRFASSASAGAIGSCLSSLQNLASFADSLRNGRIPWGASMPLISWSKDL